MVSTSDEIVVKYVTLCDFSSGTSPAAGGVWVVTPVGQVLRLLQRLNTAQRKHVATGRNTEVRPDRNSPGHHAGINQFAGGDDSDLSVRP